MIIKMIDKYKKDLTDFLFEFNNQKEYYIAWIPENYEEIWNLDKSNFILCIEKDKIVGCIGAYISREQKVTRLLGPIIIKEYFNKFIDNLFESFLQSMPKDMVEYKIAFFQDNYLCKDWCERNKFELYNAENNMIYKKNKIVKLEELPSVILKPFEPKYREGLAMVHPKGTFFTLNELIDGIDEYRHLLVAIVNDQVAGYICFEQTKDNKDGEILLLHVKIDKRNKGYGTLLLSTAINILVNKNVEEISISVRANNYKAQKLYERIGFVNQGTIYAYRK
ncbi:MAG: hypothetical protein K0R54_1264 [Clostridiaceae bacterium]|jgi:ribosomal protein S18 acetylase RimI-like enzyme|nr:hypothetical protein [Clostridiaceae bacterium]